MPFLRNENDVRDRSGSKFELDSAKIASNTTTINKVKFGRKGSALATEESVFTVRELETEEDLGLQKISPISVNLGVATVFEKKS